MAHRSPRIHTTHRQRIWPILLLLLVAVIVPVVCVAWFMTEAMGNERLAVRQKLTAVYRNQLDAVSRRLASIWEGRAAALMSVDIEAPASEIFAQLVHRDLVDGVIVYNEIGQVRYPSAPTPLAGGDHDRSEVWLDAERLEFARKDLAAAAEAWEAIATASADLRKVTQALRAQARCLARAGQQQAAIDVLTGTLAGPEFRHVTDQTGYLITPNAQLHALQLLDDPASDTFRVTLNRLVDFVNDYTDSALSGSQRLFLMQQLQAIAPGDVDFPTMDAEALAAEYVERDNPTLESELLQAIENVPGVWGYRTTDGIIVALVQEERIVMEAQMVAGREFSLPDARIELLPPGHPVSDATALFTAPANGYLTDWTLALRLDDPDPFAAAAEKRIAVYLWTGVLVIGVIVVLAFVVARFVGAQMQLARLKNDLTATVTHELKTPLASMRALIDTILEGRCRDEQQRREYLLLIGRENERLSRLIDNFLAFSRMERHKRAFEFEEVRINVIVDAALDAVRERFGSPRLRPEVEIAPGLPAISADADALTTVLINLLDNAYKYTGNDKRVIVRAYPVNGNVHLEVEDNGIGLSRQAAKRVFNRFYQADQTLSRGDGGCGLGLSIVRFIVAAHGGSVTVASQLGQGSTFTVTLPVYGAMRTPQH